MIFGKRSSSDIQYTGIFGGTGCSLKLRPAYTRGNTLSGMSISNPHCEGTSAETKQMQTVVETLCLWLDSRYFHPRPTHTQPLNVQRVDSAARSPKLHEESPALSMNWMWYKASPSDSTMGILDAYCIDGTTGVGYTVSPRFSRDRAEIVPRNCSPFLIYTHS